MPIKQRKRRKVNLSKSTGPKLSPKLRKHRKICADLYNRLQADPDDARIDILCMDIAERAGLHGATDHYLLVEALLRRVDATVSTHQLNYPDHWAYQVSMRWINRETKPRHGYAFPSVYCIKTEPRLIHAVILCYIELCKNAGKFI